MRHFIRTSLALLLATAPAVHAQAPTPVSGPPSGSGELRGVILDAKDSTPLPRASVTVRSTRDSAVVAGALASPTGVFRIQGLRPGAYSYRVTSIGYSPRVQEFTVSLAAPLANIGTVRLTRFAVALKGIAVTEERAAVAIEPDRNTYQAKDVAPGAGNVSEVLDQVPSVQVDGDGKVSLRGNENVAVQINGRPAPITGTQLGTYLKSLPANIVDRIEVVPSPSAKYDPEGMAGIINIVLKQNTDLGLSGGANASAANAGRFNGSGNLGYQSGPLTTFLTVGVNHDDRDVVGINDRQRLNALSVPLAITSQDIATRAGNLGQNVTANADYRINARDVLSNALTINHRSSTDATNSAYSELDGARALTDRYDRLRSSRTGGTMFDYDIALKRTIEPRKHELSGEVRYNHGSDDDATTLWRQNATSRVEGERDESSALTQQLTAQLDYLRAFNPRTKLEAGYKGNARWLDRDFTVLKDALGQGTWAPSNLSNSLSFDETVNAAYGVLSQGVGHVDLQAGLRAEIASRDVALGSSAKRYPYRYGSLFPSATALVTLNEATQAKVSYSRRIRRPGSQELNPFPSFFDIQNVFIGNPTLDPEYTDAVELGLTRTGQLGTLQLSPFYRHTSNVIRVIINTADVIDGREVTSVSFSNLATSNSWGTDLNGSLRLGPKLSAFAGANVFKMVTDGGSLSSVGSNAVAWSARVNGTSQLSPTLSFNASYFYRAPMKIERGEFGAIKSTNFSLRKKLYGDAAAVSLRVVDPFNTNQFRILAGDDNVIQLTERSSGVRGVFLAYQYTYGRAPKIRQPKAEENQSSAPFP